MPTFDQLSQTSDISAGDQIPVYVSGQGDVRRMSVTTLSDFVRASLDDVTGDTIYGITTSGTTFIVTLQPAAPGKSLWARLDPPGSSTIGTFVLPVIDYRANGQEILITSTQAVSAVVFTLNGTTVIGGPTSMTAGGFFRLRYDSTSNTYNRVG